MSIADALLPEFDQEMARPAGCWNAFRLVHHRGQLTVYLRLIDVPIPSIYGPTANEPMPGLSPSKA